MGVCATHAVAATLTDASSSLPRRSRSSLFLCLFCSRNANLCDPYYACYPGAAGANGGGVGGGGAGHQYGSVAVLAVSE